MSLDCKILGKSLVGSISTTQEFRRTKKKEEERDRSSKLQNGIKFQVPVSRDKKIKKKILLTNRVRDISNGRAGALTSKKKKKIQFGF